MKKLLSLILSLLMIFSVCSTLTVGASDGTAAVTPVGSQSALQIDYITAVGTGHYGFLNNISWEPDEAKNRMTEVSPKVYEITYPAVQSGKEYLVKFAANGSWNVNWGKDDDAPFSFGAANEATFDSGNINFTPVSGDPYVSVKLRLDLSKYSASTKKGATYTVTVGKAGGSVTEYDLWVGGTRVTELNKDDIFANDTARYNPATNTLTLKRAVITDSYSADEVTASIYAEGMNLTVKGSGTIGSDTVEAGIFLMNSYETLDNTLTLNGDFTIKGEYGVVSVGNLTIDGGTITSTGTVMAYSDVKLNADLRILEVSNADGMFGSFDGSLILDPSLKIFLPEGGKVKDGGIADANGQWADHIVIGDKTAVILGDADEDAGVSILDATCIQRHIAELSTTHYNKKAADADEDGDVTILDATTIQRHLAGLSSNPDIGKLIV